MVAAQHPRQVAGDALRQHQRNLRADAQELHVRDGAQAAQQPFQLVGGDGQRVAARQQHVADLPVRGDVVDRALPLRQRKSVFAAAADHPAARAVTTIGAAESGGQEQHAIGIAVDEAGHGGVVVLAERIVGLADRAGVLAVDRDVRAAQRLLGVGLAEQAGVIRRDADGKRPFVAGDGAALILAEPDHPGERPEVANAVAQLPAPVVPVGGAGVREKAAAERARAFRLRERGDALALLDGRREQRPGKAGGRRVRLQRWRLRGWRFRFGGFALMVHGRILL